MEAARRVVEKEVKRMARKEIVMFIMYAAIIAAAISAYSQYRTNKQQKDLANTAVQRRADDLRAAGFNPILAGTGGAATPALKSPGADLVDATKQSSALNLQKKLIGAQTAKLGAETRKADAQTAVLKEEVPLRAAQLSKAQFMAKLFQRLDTLGMSIEELVKNPRWAGLIANLAVGSSAQSQSGKVSQKALEMLNALGFKHKTRRTYFMGETIPPGVKGFWEFKNDKPWKFHVRDSDEGRIKKEGMRPAVTREF